MKYEWDENKAVKNLAKHGVSFTEAKTIFFLYREKRINSDHQCQRSYKIGA